MCIRRFERLCRYLRWFLYLVCTCVCVCVSKHEMICSLQAQILGGRGFDHICEKRPFRFYLTPGAIFWIRVCSHQRRIVEKSPRSARVGQRYVIHNRHRLAATGWRSVLTGKGVCGIQTIANKALGLRRGVKPLEFSMACVPLQQDWLLLVCYRCCGEACLTPSTLYLLLPAVFDEDVGISFKLRIRIFKGTASHSDDKVRLPNIPNETTKRLKSFTQ